MNRQQRRAIMKMERKIWNTCPTMIHEKHYIKSNCCLCGTKMETVHDTHNPYPLTEVTTAKQSQLLKDGKDRCCSKCDRTTVLSARLKMTNAEPSNLLSFATITEATAWENEQKQKDPNYELKGLFDPKLYEMPEDRVA